MRAHAHVALALVSLSHALACARPSLPSRALADGVRVASPPGAGRYAMILDAEEHGGCSQSHFDSASRASIVLSLDDDGGASGCRGRRWTSIVASNMPLGEEDPHPDTTQLVEQQGMRGRWREVGDALRIDLALDDTVCPPTRNAASLEARPWSLECVAVAPSKAGLDAEKLEPPFPALACKLVDFPRDVGVGAYPHDAGYTVAEPFLFFGRDTIFLAPDPGVVIEEHAYGALSPDGMRTWKRPSSPITFDAWSR
jgi:hypothetical protein